MTTSPDQQRKVAFQLPQALIEAMKAQAKKHRRFFTGDMVWALERYIAECERSERRRRDHDLRADLPVLARQE